MSLYPRRAEKHTIGDCEVCDRVDIEVWQMHGNIMMCQDCKTKEETVQSKIDNIVIHNSRMVDTSIELKQDIFNAKTVALQELRSAFEHDENIPSDKKEYEYAKECLLRLQGLQKAIFEERQSLLDKENEARAIQTAIQTSAGKLREDLRAQFKLQDITYQPVVKTIKPKKPHAPSVTSKGKLNEVKEAAKKYGVDPIGVQAMVVSRHMSADDAAREFARMLGKDTSVN